MTERQSLIQEIRALRGMDLAELERKYTQVLGHAPEARQRDLIIRSLNLVLKVKLKEATP